MSEAPHRGTRAARALYAASIAAWLLAPLAWLNMEIGHASLNVDVAKSAQPVLLIIATGVLISVARNRRWGAAERLVLAGSCAALSFLTPLLFASVALGALLSTALSFPLAFWAFDAAFTGADAGAEESQKSRVLAVLSAVLFVLVTHRSRSEVNITFCGDVAAIAFAVAHFKRRQAMATRAALWASWFVGVFSDYAMSVATLARQVSCGNYRCGHNILEFVIPPLLMEDSAPRFAIVVVSGAMSSLFALRDSPETAHSPDQ